MKLNCENSQSLVPSYLDGQLTEGQAAPLRAHLIECPSCREVAKEGKNLQRWFVDEAALEAPQGFAARVARRAFQGDPGLPPVIEPAAPVTPASPASSEPGRERSEGREGRGTLLPFLLTLSTAAAALLLVFALGIQKKSLPEGNTLDASDPRPPWETRANQAGPTDQVPADEDENPEDEEGEAESR